MSDYAEYSNNYSPTKRVIDRKIEQQSDWAELVKTQQAMAERMILQEREMKNMQKYNLAQTLQAQMLEKQAAQKAEQNMKKQIDQQVVMARKSDYDHYQDVVKHQKQENKKVLYDEYARMAQEREEEKKRKVEQEKLYEQRLVSDSIDSLQREKLIRDRQREEIRVSMQQSLKEKEEQKRIQQEMALRDREEQRRLMIENAQRIENKDQNYKQYFQAVQNHQNSLQANFQNTVINNARMRDLDIDAFINRGIEEARQRDEREAMDRYAKKQDQLRGVKESIQNKIHEHEEQKRLEKMTYQQKTENLAKQQQEMQTFEDKMKQYKQSQQADLRSAYDYQMKEAEELRRKQQVQMLDHEKKMLLVNANALIPGIRSTKFDYPQGNRFGASNLIATGGSYSPINPTNPVLSPTSYMNSSASYGAHYSGNYDKIPTPKLTTPYQSQSLGNINPPPGFQQNDAYNPITNPIPSNQQNPYVRDPLRGSVSSQDNLQNTLGNSANRNFFA